MNQHRLIRHVVASLLAVLGLLVGCEEFGALPVGPATPEATTDWVTVFPEHPVIGIGDKFALDVDDVWLAGSRGIMVHFDGESVTRHRLSQGTNSADFVDGCRHDEVWALADRELYRWDGHDWTHAVDVTGEGPYWSQRFYDLWNDEPGVVFLAGEDHGLHRGQVKRWDGHTWKRWFLGGLEAEVYKVWRPAPELPLMAMTNGPVDSLYVFDGSTWTPLDFAGNIRRSDGRLLVVTCPDNTFREEVHRIGRDGTLTPVCLDFELYSDRIIDGREPIFLSEGNVVVLRTCTRVPVGVYESQEYFWVFYDWFAPRRSGADAGSFFRCEGGDLERFTWVSDDLIESVRFPFAPDLAVDGSLLRSGEDLVCISTQDQLLLGSSSEWSEESFGDLRVFDLSPSPDGGVLVFLHDQATDQWLMAHRSPAGAVTWSPPLSVNSSEDGWYDPATGEFSTMTRSGEFMVSRHDAWQIRDTLGGRCLSYGAVAADQRYAELETEGNRRWLLEFDGEVWRDVTPAGYRYVSILMCGQASKQLVCRGSRSDESWQEDLLIHDGERWHIRPDSPVWLEYHEGSDGEIYCFNSQVIYRLHPHGKKLVFDVEDPRYPGDRIADIMVDADHGLYIVDGLHQVHLLPGWRP